MGRPKGSKNRPVNLEEVPAVITPIEAQDPQPPADDYDLTLSFRVERGGNFHGLWRLYRIQAGVPYEVGSATDRLSTIAKARQLIARCG